MDMLKSKYSIILIIMLVTVSFMTALENVKTNNYTEEVISEKIG